MNGFVRTQLDAAEALDRGGADWLAAARRQARAAFARSGLPGPRDEPWKYTNLRALAARTPTIGDPGAAARSVDLAALDLPGLTGPRLVFANGVFRPDLSRLDDLPPGVELAPLGRLLTQDSARIRRSFEAQFIDVGAGLAQINTALATEGVWLRIADGARVETPIHLVFAGIAADGDIAWHLRNTLQLGDGASATVIEQHLGSAGAVQIGNLVDQVRLGARSTLHHVRIQEAATDATLVSRTESSLGEGAQLSAVALELGAGLARHDVRVRLEGAGARVNVRGATALRGRQHMDAQYEVRHVAPGASSDVRWRGIADQRARAVFSGALVVEPGADGSDAQLSNKNLLLSPHAEIDSRPVLEIHADEVKAAHGATVGRLDEQALFYLRSRGVDEALARGMLTFAFCADVFSGIAHEPLRSALGARFARHLPRLPGEVAA